MRLGIYTPNYPGFTGEGGIGTYTRVLSHALAAAGHSVHVLTPGSGPSRRDDLVAVHFCSTKHLPGIDLLVPGAGACWRVGRAMSRLVTGQRLDVVEFPNWEGRGLLFQATRRVPTVVRLSTSSSESQQIDS